LDPERALRVLVAGMMADPEGSSEARASVEAFARLRGLSEARVNALVSEARAGGLKLELRDGAEAEASLRGLIRVCLADHVLRPPELEAILALGRTVGLGPDSVEALVREEVARLR